MDPCDHFYNGGCFSCTESPFHSHGWNCLFVELQLSVLQCMPGVTVHRVAFGKVREKVNGKVEITLQNCLPSVCIWLIVWSSWTDFSGRWNNSPPLDLFTGGEENPHHTFPLEIRVSTCLQLHIEMSWVGSKIGLLLVSRPVTLIRDLSAWRSLFMGILPCSPPPPRTQPIQQYPLSLYALFPGVWKGWHGKEQVENSFFYYPSSISN